MSQELPEGFEPVKEAQSPEVQVAMMSYEAWEKGGTAYYRGVVDLAPESGKDRSEVHAFSGPTTPDGAMYGLWKCQSLDRQLKHVRAGELVYLQYHGMQPHPTLPDSKVHVWVIARDRREAEKAAKQKASRDLPADFR